MTAKELHKLNRRELLQLMLSFSEETEETKKQLEETTAQLELTSANYERLRKRLDMKDEQIKELRLQLEAQRKKREIELQEAGNIAMAALKLNGVFEAAQRAADQYVYNMRKRLEELERADNKPKAEETQHYTYDDDDEDEDDADIEDIENEDSGAEDNEESQPGTSENRDDVKDEEGAADKGNPETESADSAGEGKTEGDEGQ